MAQIETELPTVELTPIQIPIKTYEIAVARYNEDISWLLTLNKRWKITIYNKGNPIDNIGTLAIRYPNINIIKLENKGREAETFAYHMLNRYDNYADLTVFIQANPFNHAPEMKNLLKVLINKTTLSPEIEKFIPMSICYDNTFPPKKITDSRINRFFTYEDFSVNTLDFIKHVDTIGAPWITQKWREQYNKLPNENIVKFFFDSIEQPQLLQPDQLTLKFCYAACFALPKYSLMQHPKSFYEKLYPKTFDKHIAPWILERMWLHMFDQNFIPENILPEYILNKSIYPIIQQVNKPTDFSIKTYEILIARYNENIEWLFNLDERWNITIYNKGSKFDNIDLLYKRRSNLTIIDIDNIGREGETIARYMKDRYNNYADLTVFLQAEPFTHAHEILTLLNILINKTSMNPNIEKYIPMSVCYDLNQRVPPVEIYNNRVNRFYHIEETSVYTLNCIYYDEYTIIPFKTEPHRKHNNYPINANIIRRFFNKLGIADKCLKPKQSTILFNFSACFALPKYSLMKYSKEFYNILHKLSYEEPENMPWILERTWLTIFDPEFDASKILPEYSLPGPE